MNDLTADQLRTSEADRLTNLLDSAQGHLLGGTPDKAIAIWKEMIAEGGNFADWGRLEYADYLFRRDEDEKAQAELVGLTGGRRVLGAPWSLAGELLEERGELQAALFFFSTAVSALTAEQRSAGAPLWARQLTASLRRVKWALEIRLDDQDLVAEAGPVELEDKSIDLPYLLGNPRVISGRLHFWARDQLGHADCLWPHSIPADSADEYYQDVERVLRAHPSGRVLTVPRSISTVDDEPDPGVRDARSMAEVLALVNQIDEGTVIEWPPGRNQVCWCGSGKKYKVCCGGPYATAGL
ncbi:hypothetical protein GCM10009554_16290 [Kribbella koreensis]|uniref:SEC-C motif-containing protein n=2 Tax=Kribbella koreensis TaxID=57909 RepID=A0ABP4A8M9_9ACTN